MQDAMTKTAMMDQLAACDFLCLDVETANADMGSICAIGLVHFKAGLPVKRLKILVDPEDEFDPVNISIHGITPEDVVGKPTMVEVFPIVSAALATAIVVHHTHFDRVAFCRAAAKYGFPEATCRWLDSARVARLVWARFAQRGYGLANLAAEFGIKFEHHDACEDAYAAGQVLLRAIGDSGTSLEDWFVRAAQPIAGRGGRVTMKGDEGGPLSGDLIVFTGKLAMPRREAAELAARAGMDVADTVTSDTTLLVVGDQDLRRLDGHERSAKHRKAEQLIKEGSTLRILGESDFNLLIGIYDRAPTTIREQRQHTSSRGTLHVTEMTPEARRITDLVEAVKTAKREGRLEDARALLTVEVERQEGESARFGCGVAPWYYEQLAIVYRKMDRDEDELAILERYDRQKKAPGATAAVLAARLDAVRARLRRM